ncbi:MAG TPA: hypothetical protein VGJ29_13625, partial [Vicinamibacterales bacterium]
DEEQNIRLGAPEDPANDLQAPVSARYPEVGRLVIALEKSGASRAMLSGSGSAVFGLFGSRQDAARAAAAFETRSRRTWVTRTVNRMRYQALAAL